MDARVARHHRVSGEARRLIAPIGLLAAAFATPGCSVDSVIAGIGAPGTTVDAKVGPATTRGAYLDAVVDAGGFSYRFLFPNEPVCQDLLAQGEGLSFVWLGLMGRITDGAERCDPVGVMSLPEWRDRQPRRTGRPHAREPAKYEVVYRDADTLQLQGRFPLAGFLGFTNTQHLVAVLPNEGVCKRFADRGTASMEFRDVGPIALTLITGEDHCTVLGLAQPLL